MKVFILENIKNPDLPQALFDVNENGNYITDGHFR
jgi:hypothetical protein